MDKKIVNVLIFLLVFVFFVGIVKAEEYSNYDGGNLLRCGGGYLSDIPTIIPKITTIIYVVTQITVPILLVIFASIDLIKAISAGKDDEIKKNQNMVIKRVIAAVLVFFVFAVVKIIITNISDSKVIDCASCFLDYKNSCS